MTQHEFVRTYSAVFEDSPWVAERASELGPFRDIEHLHGAMVACVEAASEGEKLELLRAHPDLGQRGPMSAASETEQAGAGLDQHREALHRLNGAYREKFGFPFIYAVKGSAVATILRELETRLNATPEIEFHEALAQVYRIARLRLDQITP